MRTGRHRPARPFWVAAAATAGVVAVLASAVLFGSGSGRAAAASSEPTGRAFAAPCARTTLIVLRGTGETKAGVPESQALGVMKNVTEPLERKYRSPQFRVHWLAYPANFNYPVSESTGVMNTLGTIDYYIKQCPNTHFVLTGYSQGAHVAGDVAQFMAMHYRRAAATKVTGVFLLADPRRDAKFRPTVGIQGGGNGMFTARTFHSLNGVATEYCAPHDPVCDAGLSLTAGPRFASEAFRSGAHTSYGKEDVRPQYIEHMVRDIGWVVDHK